MAITDFSIRPAEFSQGQNVVGLGALALAKSNIERDKQAQAESLRSGLLDVMTKGGPSDVFDFVSKNPKALEIADQMANFTSNLTKQHKIQSAKRILSGEDPTRVLGQHSAFIANQGGDPAQTNMLAEQSAADPSIAIKNAEKMLALYDPDAFKEYAKQTGLAKSEDKGTANIQDWRHYRKLLESDPAQAEQFARQVGINKGAEPEIKPTTAMQNYEKWSAMPEGAQKNAFGVMIGINPKDSPEDARKLLQEVEKAAREVESSDAVIGMATDLLGNDDYISAITGFRGATPFSIPGTEGYDAMVAFEQLKDNLTLENLSKMSGVLTDRDIQILASAGAGLKAGMSASAMRGQLNKIRDVLIRKSERQRAKLEGMGYSPESDKPLSEMTDDELMKTAFGAK